MIRKCSIIMMVLFLIVASSLCSANKAVVGETSISGLYIGLTYNEVVSVYGPPKKDQPYYNPFYANGMIPAHHNCLWGNAITVQFGDSLGQYQNVATWISVSNSEVENNGLYTPKGVHIGMAYDEAKRIYGISSKAKQFYVLSPDRRTYMCISVRYSIAGNKKAKGLGLVDSIKIGKIETEKDRASFEKLLYEDGIGG